MNVAIIKAGGVGSRMNKGIPKQFIIVDDKPLIIHTLEKFQNHPNIDDIIVVCIKGWEDNLKKYAQKFNITKLKAVIDGGETSLRSILNGVNYVRSEYKDEDIIMIHDANRPLVSEDIISDVLAEAKKYEMAVATIPCDDETAIVNVVEGHLESKEFINHKEIYRIQTPDAYTLEKLKKIFDDATQEQLDKLGSTNVLAIHQGFVMHFAEGSATNIRLTSQEDIELFKALLLTKEKQ